MKRRDILKTIGISWAALAVNPALALATAPKEDDFTLLAIGAHSVKVYVPKPFEFGNIAGQTIFPYYSNGFPTTRAGAYLFPNREDMAKIDGAQIAAPPISGYSLCSHKGARYATIAVVKQTEKWDQEAAERLMQSVVDQAVESLKNFHVVTPGDMTHIWPKETKEERDHRLGKTGWKS